VDEITTNTYRAHIYQNFPTTVGCKWLSIHPIPSDADGLCKFRILETLGKPIQTVLQDQPKRLSRVQQNGFSGIASQVAHTFQFFELIRTVE
jgi:hypothetical protein